MKRRICYVLNLIWTGVIAFTFPLSFAWIFLDITGHAKGYDYDLGSEADVSVMLGCIELLIWLVLAVPSSVYVFLRTKEKGWRYVLLWAAGCITLAAVQIFLFYGGVPLYLEEVFNISY